MNYEDYFEIEHIDGPNGEVTMDEFIAEAMRTDIKYDATADSIDHPCSVRHILKDEILTCYQFLKENKVLDDLFSSRETYKRSFKR